MTATPNSPMVCAVKRRLHKKRSADLSPRELTPVRPS